MMAIRSSLGQFYQVPQTQPQAIDPLLHIGLQTAGQVLARSDPGAPETFQLLERIIVAPGFPSYGQQPTGPTIQRVSDLNPTLGLIAWTRENSILATILALSIPAFIFLLGRQAGMRAR